MQHLGAFMRLGTYRKSFICMAFLGICVAVVPLAWSQSPAGLDKHERKMEKRIAKFRPGTYVQLDFRDSSQAYGSLGVVSTTSFQFTNADSNKVATYSYGDVTRIRKAKQYIGAGSSEHHMRLWIPVVIGAVAAGGAVAAYEVLR